MKMSKTVSIVGVAALAAALAGCADEPEEYEEKQTAYGEVCMKYNRASGEYDVRVPDDECDRDTGHSHFNWIYIHHGGGYSAPPMGGKLQPGSYTAVKPAGATIARPPATGGFGTFRAPVGG